MLKTLRWRLGLGIIALAGLVLLSLTPVWQKTQHLTQVALTPLIRVARVSVAWFSTLATSSQRTAEYAELLNQLAQRKAQEVQTLNLEQENLELRTLNSVKVATPFIPIGAEVVGKNVDDTGTSYLINRGSTDGLTPGMPLVAGFVATEGKPRAILVGTLRTVSPRISSFTFTTSNSSRIVAEIVNRDRAQGLAIGEFNLAIRLKYIPRTAELVPGDVVVTSNLDELMPQGLLIGEVSSTERKVDDFFQTAIVVPPLPLEHFRFLYVLKREST